MLDENLLLDSASCVSNHVNTYHGCPENTFPGDLKSWYVLRATYSRELKVCEELDKMGIRTFVPMIWRKKVVDGKSEKRLVPAVGSMCFVYWTKEGIDGYIRGFGGNSPVHYYWDRIDGRPLTVPERAMEDFMAVASTADEDLIYMTEINDKLRGGEKVIVKAGPFKGVHGTVVRVRKSRRIMVEIPGMLAVASAYVPLKDLEII